MKLRNVALISALLLAAALPLRAQAAGNALVEPVQAPESPAAATLDPPPPPPSDPGLPSGIRSEPAGIPDPPAPDTSSIQPGAGTTLPPGTPAPNADSAKFPPLEAQKKQMEQAEEGYLIKDASLNDIFQFLAKKAGRQYFHNFKIAGPDFRVTGHLNDGNPLQQMEELSFMYGLTLYTKGNTVYALTQAQLNTLPGAEFHYQLRYLRPSDMEQIKDLIKPFLTPGTGIVNFEPKTNTIIIIDSANKVEKVRDLLHGIDRAKGQIVVETKILRVNDTAAKRSGMDWSSTLGKNGVPFEVSKSLNAVFGLDSVIKAAAISKGSSVSTEETPNSANSLVLSPIQLNGVLRALGETGLARQVSNPTLITEDNEQATIAIIDRVPILTTVVSQTTGSNNISEEVRYKIDKEDPSISADPNKHREIGISLVVTPTLLPDGTVRMKLRPRSAQIVEQIKGQSGNLYPHVSESMIDATARVPDGHSLVVGGFYGEIEQKNNNSVPFLGKIPLIGFFFHSKETTKEKSSLVFIVTPTSYNPAIAASNDSTSRSMRRHVSINPAGDWPDQEPPLPSRNPSSLRGAKASDVDFSPAHPLNQSDYSDNYGGSSRGR